MKLRFAFLASMTIALTLALVGVLKDTSPTRATMPRPVQPFAAQAKGGVSTTQLGEKIDHNFTVTQVLRGERTTTPWMFSGPGFSVDLDKNIYPDGTVAVGTVWATIDVDCDGETDYLYDVCPNDGAGITPEPLTWKEATTVVQGTSDQFLIPLMPPYSWLARHKVDIDHVCIGRGGFPLPTTSVLNTVYASIPFSPNGGAGVASTLLGGAPNGPPSPLCLDTPNTSQSITSLVNNPPPEGDLGGPCNPLIDTCADAGIYGMWTSNTVNIPLVPGQMMIPVEKHKVNNGPQEGDFMEHWDVDTTNPDIVVAEWAPSGSPIGPILDEPISLPVNVDTVQPTNLFIQCKAPGWGLLVLKNILWPILPTQDTYLDDNAFIFVVKVVCGTPTGGSEVDKEVAFIRILGPDHLPLGPGVGIPIIIDELKENHAPFDVPGTEWLVAESPDLYPPEGPDVIVQWTPIVTIQANGHPPQSPEVTDCSSLDPDHDACISFPVNEWPGQADVETQLNVMCDAETPPGIYPVVIKAIDMPTGGIESKPSDNAQRKVISVWCGGEVEDDLDDGSSLYPRWTIFQSMGESQFGLTGDIRKSHKSPPSFPSDRGYVERTLQLDCYWMDFDGCFTDVDGTVPCDSPTASPPGNNNNYIEASESWNDYEFQQMGGYDAVDKDHDCLMDPAFAQPGHPVDALDDPTGAASCDGDPNWVNYSENPVAVHHNKAEDQDCDGLPDGVEKAWGSNPLRADSDSDGSADFVEMFMFTNPVNPDTDGDGFKDKPAGVYLNDGTGRTATGTIVPADHGVDNCPTVANADQANNDGKPRDNGPQIGGLSASNPAQDKIGNACDSDDDNDDAVDGYETSNANPALRSNPLKFDTDGDTVGDGAEWRLGPAPPNPNTWPTSALLKPAWSSIQQTYYRGCNIAVNESYTGFGRNGGPAGREMDVDGDGILCPTDLDADNGGLGHAAKDEIIDSIEAFGYGTSTANPDTDGDGCEDWCEISDLNGDRRCDIGDFLLLTLRKIYPAAGSTPPDAVSDIVFDVDRNTKIDVGDQLQEVLNSYGLKPWGGGPLCPNEN